MKNFIMPVTVDMLTKARNLAHLIRDYEDLIVFFSSKTETFAASIKLEDVISSGLKSECQIKREFIIDMLGAQCDKLILDLEKLGFSVESD